MRIHTRVHWFALCLLILAQLWLLAPAPFALASGDATDVDIYVDAVVAPWDSSYSYGTTVNEAGGTAYQGTNGLAVTHTDAYGALSVYNGTALPSAEYQSISFWAYGAAGGSSISLSIGEEPTEFYNITIPAGTWTNYNVALSELGNPATIQRINWQDTTGAPQATYYLDNIRVLAKQATTGFPDATSDGMRSLVPGPSGVAIAPNGRVYAVVYQDSRVYSWATVTAMLNGDAPDKTFGAANGDPDGPTGCTNGPSATVMCGPESVAVDSNGNLFVADTYNHRVLVFNNPDTDASPTSADGVIGQPDLNSNMADYDAVPNDGVLNGFCFVRGLAVESGGALWVVDEFNYRVVRVGNPTVNGGTLNKVFGQADLDDQAAGCEAGPSGNSAANRFSLPLGVAVDAQGTVFVADLGNNRVQRFAANAANGANAEASYTNLNQPHDVAVDKNGSLYVSDTLNSQVLVFGDGASGDLAADHTFPNRNFPMGMAFAANGDFLVADCGAPAANSTYPPCVSGTRGVYFFAASAQPQYQRPTAVDDEFTGPKNQPISGNVLANDTDPQGSTLKIINHQPPVSGDFTIAANGDFTFTPNADFVGTTYFSYAVTNEYDLGDQGSVTIVITEGQDPDPDPDPDPASSMFIPMLSR